MSKSTMAARWVREATGMTGREVDYWRRRLRLPLAGGPGRWWQPDDATIERLRAIKIELVRHRAAMANLLGSNPMPAATASYNKQVAS